MSAPLLQSFAGQDADLQAQLSRQFRENLARNPDAMAAYLKATGGQTPAESPSALRAFQTEQSAATRRANQVAAGRAAVEEQKALQAMTQPRASGLMQSQVQELPGGGKAVYDREGRLVGTNIATGATVDRAAVNRGEGTVAEGQSLRAAMDKAVRDAMQARPAPTPTPVSETLVARPGRPAAEIAAPLVAGAMAGPASPSTLGEQFLSRLLAPRSSGVPLADAERPPVPQEPLSPEVAAMLFGEEPFAQAAQREQRDDAARARMSRQLDRLFAGKKPATPKPESSAAANLMGRGLVPEIQQGLFSAALGLTDLYSNYLGRPLDRLLFGIPIPEQPSQLMEEYQRSVGRPTGWTGF